MKIIAVFSAKHARYIAQYKSEDERIGNYGAEEAMLGMEPGELDHVTDFVTDRKTGKQFEATQNFTVMNKDDPSFSPKKTWRRIKEYQKKWGDVVIVSQDAIDQTNGRTYNEFLFSGKDVPEAVKNTQALIDKKQAKTMAQIALDAISGIVEHLRKPLIQTLQRANPATSASGR